ncbi:MAG: response regulator [Elusimicrobiales bacterium]|jgi:signal transduction histidine kinase
MPKILVVEDDHNLKTLIEAVMNNAGYAVELAANGLEALEKAGRTPPDIIVSDVMMPEMDGFMLCRKLKKDGLLRKVPVILYTSTAVTNEEEKLALELGAVRFVSKPAGVKALLAAVQEELGKGGTSPQPLFSPAADETVELDRKYLQVLSRKLQFKEQELEKARKDLAESNERLRRTQRLDSMGQLSGGIAHDLNNLLGPIIGYADFLRKSLPAGDPRHGDVDEITKAAERAAVLIRQLLAFSRKQFFEVKVVDLNSIVNNIGAMLQRAMGEQVRIVYALDPAGALVKVDAGQMEHCLVNLVVNARDAMPRGGTLTIATSSCVTVSDTGAAGGGPAPGRYALLTVSDTGRGMDEATLGRIFEPFFTTKALGMGIGLGLSMVYGIVKQSGGDIQAESKPGAGSVFRIYLPLVSGTGEQPSAKPSPLSKKGWLLLVEDDKSMRRIAARVLSGAGYTVMEARDGKEALKRLEESHSGITVLITDMVMPEVDGLTLSMEVLAKYPHIRILCMSGYVDKEEEFSRVLGSKADYLQKPFSPDTLLEKVKNLVAPDAPGASTGQG